MATASTVQSKIKQALKKEYVKTAILFIILIGGMLSFWFGIRAVFRAEDPFMSVVSGSMEPTLPVGTLIVVQGYADPSTVYAAPTKWDENHTRVLEGGDILVFQHWDSRGLQRWVHRAVGKISPDGKTYFVTLGDNNHGMTDSHYNITDDTHPSLPGLPVEYVVGKVVANVPVIGQVIMSMQTTEGRIVIIMLIVVLLIIEFIPFPRKKDEEKVLEQGQVKA